MVTALLTEALSRVNDDVQEKWLPKERDEKDE